METTLPAAYQKLKENLEITGVQKSTVSTRQQSIRNSLSGHLNVVDSLLTGSYSRNTMISPLSESDIDIMVVLDTR
jgi:predicted nucleotidyltransferase